MSATMAPLVPALDDAARRGNGCLNVTGPRVGQQAQIYFDGGLVYAVHVHTFTPLIGRRLLSNGSLTSDQYANLLARNNGNEQDAALGVQAVKAGYFRQDVLDDVLEEILAAAFMEILSWANPVAKFKRRARTNHLVTPKIQITTLLQAARRRGAHWRTRWEHIGYDPMLVHPLAAEGERDDDPDGISRLLAGADGTLGLRALAHLCGLTYHEVGQTLLDLFADGRVTFLLPAPSKDTPMLPSIPVTNIAPAVDAVPGLPLPPLPNFDGQTLPPSPLAVQDGPPAPANTANDDVAPHEGATVEPVPALQEVVAVDFNMDDAMASDITTQVDQNAEPLPEATDLEDRGVEVDMQPESSDPVVSEAPDMDPRAAAQQVLLADELDAATEAVQFAEGTIERLTHEEQAHQFAANQATAHQQRYEAFLVAAEAERQRLTDEQASVAAEAEALAVTAEELEANHAALSDTLRLVEERAAVAARELEEAQHGHETAVLALVQAREAATEIATTLEAIREAEHTNQVTVERLVEGLSVVESRTQSYASEINEASQSVADLNEAAQASARLRERAEQRLVAARTTLASKATDLHG